MCGVQVEIATKTPAINRIAKREPFWAVMTVYGCPRMPYVGKGHRRIDPRRAIIYDVMDGVWSSQPLDRGSRRRSDEFISVIYPLEDLTRSIQQILE